MKYPDISSFSAFRLLAIFREDRLQHETMTNTENPITHHQSAGMHAGHSDHAAVCQVMRRNHKVTAFDRSKIMVAISKAFLAIEGGTAAASSRVHEVVDGLTTQVVDALLRRLPENGTIHIEDIQDQVELALMREGHHKVARAYVLYRAARASERSSDEECAEDAQQIHLTLPDGKRQQLDMRALNTMLDEAVSGLADVDRPALRDAVERNIFDGMKEADYRLATVMSARTMIERDPAYSQVAARILLHHARHEALSFIEGRALDATQADMQTRYMEYFPAYIRRAVELELLDEELGRYDLQRLGEAIQADYDSQFSYLGLQTLYDRYFIHHGQVRFELPQAFFMRVAMGLAINEVDREARAIEFYHLLAAFDFMSSTPTLFNAGTLRPQMSSCYLTTVPDALDGIYDAIKDNALLSKYAGGLGNDWSAVRGMGAYIKGTNGASQGVIPFLKVANDTAVAVNQGGKRKGAVCAYLETWHIDIEDFLELRKNTGDERRRTHDMNTANWIPDLFMKRVAEEGNWTLFSPDEAADLHEKTGRDFEAAYEAYEARAARGEMKISKTLPAVELWRKMLGMLFETGHPWVTFKDPCNIRYTNAHEGVVHSSNLCTEITLHTHATEVAVCNLGSVNLARHIRPDGSGIDHEKLERTIHTAMRMLDNVIDYNYYSVPQARKSNLRHRPVGMGIMGFSDSLYQLDLAYASHEAVEFADRCMEAISYYAIHASSMLAEERGRYSSYAGSLWSKGILPIDSLQLLKQERGEQHLQVDDSSTLDWDRLRALVKAQGMRNSNVLAIAPTATIANICGVSQSIEPAYQNLYVKSNLSGEFVVMNHYLVEDLKKIGLWDEVMLNDLKYFDGSLHAIERVPEHLKAKYATAFEIDSRWLIEAASRRQKWIDQAQSLNLYMAEASGKKLDNLYKLAWVRGLKTTYYLRSMGASHVEKSTENMPRLEDEAKICSILDPDCEACQ